ncbi:MAG: pseudouridine synthase [Polyangiaceae bacterium]
MPPLHWLYLDDALAVVAKPSGLLVHRGWGDDAVTLTDLARADLGDGVSPAHRLDRGTSGVLVLSRSSEAAARLGSAFEAGEVEKAYLALVRGSAPDEGLIDHPIPRREGGPRVPAITAFRTLARVDPGIPEVRCLSLVEARPRTGRLHQVRRHLKHIHHPLIGDANYGKGVINRALAASHGLSRLALHATSLRLRHPITGEEMVFEAPLPADLTEPFARLGIAASFPRAPEPA